jgi:hypothetical protein
MARYFKNDGKIYLACQSSNQIKAFICKTKKNHAKIEGASKVIKAAEFFNPNGNLGHG